MPSNLHMFKTCTTVLFALSLAPLWAQSNSHEKRLEEAGAVFEEVMGIAEKAIPQDLLARAQCIVIVPNLKKGAFIVGGKFGRGFFTCRKADKVGWSAPAAIKVEGGSVGFQIGGSESDIIMVVQNESGANRLLSSKFTLGADASVAAGPVGRVASADTDLTMKAEILTYSRSRGLFAGVSLQGATLRPDEDANHILYGHSIAPKDIISGATPPAKAGKLLSLLNKYSSRK